MLYANKQSQSAVDALALQGIAVPTKPDYDVPTLPADITDLGDEDLMVLYSKLTAYADFIAVQVSCAQVDERSYEKRLSALESQKMLKGTGKSENRVTFARAEVANDPEVIDLKDHIEELYAYRKLIEAMANNIERDTALVSRELTRRTSNTTRRRTF
jgi:hypothetical protein